MPFSSKVSINMSLSLAHTGTEQPSPIAMTSDATGRRRRFTMEIPYAMARANSQSQPGRLMLSCFALADGRSSSLMRA